MLQRLGRRKKSSNKKPGRVKQRKTNRTKIKNLRSQDSVIYLLDSGTIEGMQAAIELTEESIKYQWDYYSELARQRDEIIGPIGTVLIGIAKPYGFQGYQRGVKYKYGLHPLCTNGSVTDVGGRFNTGEKVNSQIPFFPALYLAGDKDTALQEHLGQVPPSDKVKKILAKSLGMTEQEIDELTPRDIALSNPSSETIVSVSGQLQKVVDLREHEALEPFIELIKGFKLSRSLTKRAHQLDAANPGIVNNTKQLQMTLLQYDWTLLPARYAVPANPQIFGHLLYLAGVEGVIYPSKYTGKPCLALYPRNFSETSFICLDDEAPLVGVPKRFDATNWRLCEQSAKEIIEKS